MEDCALKSFIVELSIDMLEYFYNFIRYFSKWFGILLGITLGILLPVDWIMHP